MISHNRPWITEADRTAIQRALDSHWIAQGPQVDTLQDWFEAAWGGYAVAVSSGTAALWLVLKTMLPAQSHIQVPTYACSAILHAVKMAGCVPQLRDVDPGTYSLSAVADPRNAILIDTFGGRAAMWDNSGYHIRDCTHSLLPPEYDDAAICSFGPTKPVTGGGGGIAWFRDKTVADRARELRDFDGRKEFKPSFNIQMSDITAALINSQLARINEIRAKRTEIALYYSDVMPISWPVVRKEAIRYRYIVEVPDTCSFITHMKNHGVECIHPIAPFELLHRYLKLDNKDFPVAESIAHKAVSLPIYPGMVPPEWKLVAAALKEYRP